MIRKFNYTGRRKIQRRNVRVDMRRDADGRRYFNIHMALGDLNLPAAARVYVEAYHRTAYQRFDFGSLGDKQVPPDRCLERFPESITPLFRVKVVDQSRAHGRILAALDKVRPASVDEQPADSQSLLYVEYADLGHRIWELDLDGDWPVLRLNRKAREIGQIAGSDDRFMALIYPEILRRVLTRIVFTEEHTDPDCDDDWPSLWLRLACVLSDRPVPTGVSRNEQHLWIEQAVESFCRRHEVVTRFEKAFQGGS